MRTFVFFAAVALALPTVVAADALTDAVKERQEHMKMRGQQVGVLAKMAKGEMDYDPAAAQAAADKLVELVNTDTSAMWVPGSSADDLPGVSYAKADLWANFAEASEINGELVAAAAAMQVAAGQGKDQMTQALGAVGGPCQDCHKAFQAKKN